MGRSYKLWDGGDLSDTRQGEPLAWLADGSLLAVLRPIDSASESAGYDGSHARVAKAGDPGDQGILSVVDRAGRSIVQVPDWLASTLGVYAFSPDGHYLAGCFADPNNLRASDRMRVIDVQTGSVSALIGSDCFWNGTGWGEDDRLYGSGPSRPQAWTPDGGATDLGLAKWLTVTPALNGNLAI